MPGCGPRVGPDPPFPMSFRFEHEVEIRWSDLDACGVLNNATYLTLLEQARWEYFSRLELLETEDRFPFLLGETCIRFLKPGGTGKLRVLAKVQQLGRKSFEMVYEVCDGDDVLANAVATLVWVDRDLKSTPIPAEARERISRFEEIPAGV